MPLKKWMRVAILCSFAITASVPYAIAQDTKTPNTTSSSIASATSNGSVAATAIDFHTEFDPEWTSAACWYPISGNYGLLNRILYYFTLIFALIVHHHLWLVAGALAATLTYSGTAAVHACLLMWRGPADAESDRPALLAILSAACLLMVPLLNWSTTLRRLEARTIVIYWGILVTAGFMCMFFTLQSWAPGTDIFVLTDLSNVTCTGISYVNDTVIDPWFVWEYGCTNPCTAYSSLSLVRPDPDMYQPIGDLRLISNSTLERFLGYSTDTREQRQLAFHTGYEKYGLVMFPYILMQGLWTVLFGRRRPFQVRDKCFLFANNLKIPLFHTPRAKALQLWTAKVWALLIYAWAVLITIISVPLFVLNIISNEFSLAEHEESEQPFQIGQWQPWVATLLALLAAIIGKYHERGVDAIITGFNSCMGMRKRLFSSKHQRHDAEKGVHQPIPTRTVSGLSFKDRAGCEVVVAPPTVASTFMGPPKAKFDEFCRPFKQGKMWVGDEWENVKQFYRDPLKTAVDTKRHPDRLKGGLFDSKGVLPRDGIAALVMNLKALPYSNVRRFSSPDRKKSRKRSAWKISRIRPHPIPAPNPTHHHRGNHVEGSQLPGAALIGTVKKKYGLSSKSPKVDTTLLTEGRPAYSSLDSNSFVDERWAPSYTARSPPPPNYRSGTFSTTSTPSSATKPSVPSGLRANTAFFDAWPSDKKHQGEVTNSPASDLPSSATLPATSRTYKADCRNPSSSSVTQQSLPEEHEMATLERPHLLDS
ncbi:MAG: hypothetical protein M1812_004378 [Candelaria pacifica]|nr:MAG: hypothetical protein M1812_004378 [Candelaria pacifica]